jgi:Domain of unknown function (DUF4845)
MNQWRQQMNMQRRQRGMTMISWMMVAGIAAFIGKFFFALLPLFMEQSRLDSVLEGTRVEYEAATSAPPKQELRRSIERRMGVNDIRVVRATDLTYANEEGLLWMGFVFEQRTEFMGNVSLVMSYNTYVPIGGGPEVGSRSIVVDDDGD